MAFSDISSSSSSSSFDSFGFLQNRPDSPPTPAFTSKKRSNRQTSKYRRLQPLMEELHPSTRSSSFEIVKGNRKAKNKWQMLTLGPMKFQPEMEMKTIRNRQRRVADRTVDGCGTGHDPTVIRSWRILHSLSCMKSVDIVGQSSPLRLMV